MRSSLAALLMLAALATTAQAQLNAEPPGMDMQTIPLIGFPAQRDDKPDTYRRLPYRDLITEIRIELPATALYDFEQAKVRPNAADLMQQAANLIYEHAKGPVRIECRSDRLPAAAAQKLATQCAFAVSQWLTVEERLTKVKFTTVGTSIAPAAAANPNDPLAPAAASRSNISIVFAKQ
jgi:outer membrane protein OmpA-like peptidoglycan-associated protein